MTEDEKKKILSELLLSEEESAADLKSIITSAKNLVRINPRTKQIIIASQYGFTVLETVVLFLVGRHFAEELGLHEQEGVRVQDLEKETGIVKTTLSKPLAHARQDEERRYHIVRHRIGEVIQALHANMSIGLLQVEFPSSDSDAETQKRQQDEIVG